MSKYISYNLFKTSKNYILCIVILIIVACNKEEEPENKPVACFTYSAVKNEVNFNSNCSSFATLFDWDFGDGSSSTKSNPTHIYDPVRATYQVALTVTNSEGSQNSFTAIVVVEPPVCFQCRYGSRYGDEYYSYYCGTDEGASDFCVDCRNKESFDPWVEYAYCEEQ